MNPSGKIRGSLPVQAGGGDVAADLGPVTGLKESFIKLSRRASPDGKRSSVSRIPTTTRTGLPTRVEPKARQA